MNQFPAQQSLIQLFSTIDSCVERKVQLPTLMLIYAGIDSLGWLAAEDAAAKVGERFTAWVDRFMLPERPLPCTATDLYSARCGILHTMTADSDLVNKGRAKRLFYAWGNADVSDLQMRLDRAYPGECVAVHINDLAHAIRLGAARMFDEADQDSELEARLIDRGGRYFVGLSTEFAPMMLPSGIAPAVTQ